MDWNEAQAWEVQFWGTCANTFNEELKQLEAARLMGLEIHGNYQVCAGNKSVLDVGGGPASLLLKASCLARGKIIDPGHYPDWVAARYRTAGLEYERLAAEQMQEAGWDEVWIINCLQHVRDPRGVVERAKAAGKVIRMFEWLETPAHPGHPQTLRAEELDGWLGIKGEVRRVHYDYGLAYIQKGYG